MLSIPILTSIFGDGSLEVSAIAVNETWERICFRTFLNQGEDTEDWAYDEPVMMEVN